MAKKKAKSKTGRRSARRSTAAKRGTSATRGKSAKRSKSSSAKRSGSGRGSSSGKRTLVAPRGDKRYVRRSQKGRFTESDDVGRSLSTDRRRKAKKKSRAGQGDRGDR